MVNKLLRVASYELGVRSPTDAGYAATRLKKLLPASPEYDFNIHVTVPSSLIPTMQCPVLAATMLLPSIMQRTRYALSDTHLS